MKSKRRAFTLVEMIVSISILMVLTVIASKTYTAYLGAQLNATNSYKSSRNANLAIQGIIEFLRANEGTITESMITTDRIIIDTETYVKFEGSVFTVKTKGPYESIDSKIPIEDVNMQLIENKRGIKLLKTKVTMKDKTFTTIYPIILKAGG